MIKLNFALSVIGIVLDIIGSLFAVLGFIATKNDDLYDQASECWVFNPKLFEALVQQRDKAIFGFVLIFIGSVCQLSSSLVSPNLTIAISEKNYFLLLGSSFVIVLLILELISRKIINKNINSKLIPMYYKTYEKYEEEMQKENSEYQRQRSIKGKEKAIINLSKQLNIKRQKLNEIDFEKLVLQKTKKYLKGIKSDYD